MPLDPHVRRFLHALSASGACDARRSPGSWPSPGPARVALDAVMALAPTQRDARRLRRRYASVRDHLFTFLEHPEITADNNGSKRELRPTATYRKVTGGFRSDWGADLFAAVRSVIGTAARRGIDAYQAIRDTLRGQSALAPG